VSDAIVSTECAENVTGVDADEQAMLEQAIAMSKGHNVDMGEGRGNDNEVNKGDCMSYQDEYEVRS